jgi:hypothetical protein
MGCLACSVENAASANFCQGCGARPARHCPQCGHEVAPASRFCQECGGPLGGSTAGDRLRGRQSTAGSPPPSPHSYTPPYLAERILATRDDLEGERKQVTVLFAEIKGLTELIEGLAPEDAKALLEPAVRAMIEAVHRYEGTVCRVMGDGMPSSATRCSTSRPGCSGWLGSRCHRSESQS